jgi:hypothetical protein
MIVQWSRLALSKGPNRVDVSLRQPRTETDPISETLCFLALRLPDDGYSPKTQWFWIRIKPAVMLIGIT